MFGTSSILIPLSTQTSPYIFHSCFPNLTTSTYQECFKLKQNLVKVKKKNRLIALSSDTSYEVGGGFPLNELLNRNENSEEDTSAQREALLKGGDQVISVLQEMITLVSSFILIHLFQLICRRAYVCESL